MVYSEENFNNLGSNGFILFYKPEWRNRSFQKLLATIYNHKTNQKEGKPKIAGDQSQEDNRKIELDSSLDRASKPTLLQNLSVT